MDRSVRRLGPGDEAILSYMAAEDADFDVAGRGAPLEPLDSAAAQRYLANPAVLHWIAQHGSTIIGELVCIIIPLSSHTECELLLYEIGVRSAWRRRGVGRELIATMEGWMREHGVAEVWLGADNPAAVEFYRACGFVVDEPRSVFMSRRIRMTAR